MDELLGRVRATLASGGWQPASGPVEMLLEEGINSTDLAAVLFHMLSGDNREAGSPVPTPASQPARAPREARGLREPRPGAAARDISDDIPALKRPAPGKLWISLNVGRGAGFGPREIVDVLAGGGGLDGRSVGAIEIFTTASYAEVPESFARSLPREGGQLDAGDSSITVAPVPKSHGDRSGKPAKFSRGKTGDGRFEKKKFPGRKRF